MSLIAELAERCTFPVAGTPVTLGVSGGADSTALLALAVDAGCVVTVVHVDHGLRPGTDTEIDRVAGLAHRFGAAFRSVRVYVEPGANLEARARSARHGALGPDALLGHTMDDRAETVLINLLRGAGSAGLAALRPPDPRRPLLGLRRAETDALCASLGIVPFADPSNDDPRFVRNRVRAELLPLMSDIADRDIVPLVVRTSDLLGADDAALGAIANGVDPTDARAVGGLDDPIATRVLRQWLTRAHGGYPPDAAEVARALSVARGENRATELAGGWRVTRREQRLRLEEGGTA